MIKKLSSKVILIFLLMLIALSSTVISSYITVDTQKQHLYLTELLSKQKLLAERITSGTINLAEIALLDENTYVERLPEFKDDLELYSGMVDMIFHSLTIKEYELEGETVPLKFRGAFEITLMDALEPAKENWAEVKNSVEFLLNTENLKDQDAYALRLKTFSALNKDLIQNADYITDICRIETEYKKNISDIVHLVSIIISLAIFILLIYLILHNFYNPLLEIKKVFKSMSKGKIKQHFVRKQEDEFKELYNDFNHFIDNLNLIFSLEDKILLENQLDNILEFIYANFRKFIPFTTMGITFQSIDHITITKIIDAFGIEEHRDPNGQLKVIQEIKIINQEILCPIIIGNANLGYVFFQFPKDDVIEESHLNFLHLIRDKISLAFYKSFLFRDLLGIVTTSLANMAESRDPETGRHLYRMANYSLLVAKRLKEKGIYPEEIDQNFIDNILVTAPMHDIGKVAIPDDILLKQGKLTDEEFELIKQHPQAGAKVLMGLHQEFKKYNIEYFQMAADIAIGHQEKFDGSGYPFGTSGNEIPLSARICAVSDVFDALSSKRPYKDAFPLEKCYQIIRASRGTHFDPEIVDAFFDVQNQIEVIYEKNKEV